VTGEPALLTQGPTFKRSRSMIHYVKGKSVTANSRIRRTIRS
jgi:hypothetical protein